ncbi:MAG: MgtC/SapB family protein [Candidatus Aenigmarchaeota archaeon]|nr:MgtC/SapB family protein [Candidatus Aenigmarchaeota archaeon]
MVSELVLVWRLILSVMLGGLIGLEREIALKPAGLRTHMLVCLAASLITILSLEAFPHADQARLSAYLVAGIGFIGGGTILKLSRDKVVGITTAASLLVTVAVGIAVGSGFYLAALITSLLSYVILRMGKVEKYIRKRF